VAVEVAGLLAAGRTAIGLMGEAQKLVTGLRQSGFLGRSTEGKQELQQALERLRASLRDVGQLATLAQGYSTFQVEVLALLSACQTVRRFTRDNRDLLLDPRQAGYQTSWRICELMFEQVSARREPIFRVLDDRTRWFTDQDRAQIEQRLNDFALQYERAAKSVEMHTMRAESELEAMVEGLNRVEATLDVAHDAVFDAIRELQQA
jgi:hypothetical protein